MEANRQAKRKQNGSKTKGKDPSFPFYPADWMKDPEVRSVSADSRGLWIDLICLMWESPEKGYLVAGSGMPYRNEHISRMTGVLEGRVIELIAEMEEVGLFSRRESDGAIYNRRMARQASISNKRAEAGSKGGSKSEISDEQDPSKSEAKVEANTEAKTKQKRLPSSSSSSSSSGERERENAREDFVEVPGREEVVTFCATGTGIPEDFADWWFSRREHDWGWQRKDGVAINWKRAVADDWASWKHKWKNQGKGANGIESRREAAPVYGKGF